MDSLEAMLDLVRRAATGLPAAAALRAETAVEELLTNTVVHGAPLQEPDAGVWLAVTAKVDGSLGLQYQDMCLAFDPKPKIEEALHRTANPMDQRPPGGLGLLMVYRLADEFRYARLGGRNCIDMAFLAQRATVASA
jgi:anti-sigma regulatory factor (Ser/Thr protein kinase)